MADWDSRLNSEINGVKQNKNTLKHYIYKLLDKEPISSKYQ